MQSSSSGRLVVISGPSGAGKTSVCRELKSDPRVEFSVSATTRRMRDGECDGVDYWFLSDDEFQRRERAGEFLESANYNGRRYGTLRAPMEAALREGKVFVLEIEVQGTRQLRDKRVPGVYVFVVPPSIEELRARLRRRAQNAPSEIEERLRIAQEEMKARDLYDHVVENVVLADTIARVRELIGLEAR
ncbi:MAG: guanylate kinase [Planctomycetota bacterium]